MTLSLEELARQVQMLLDIEAIKRLKHAYFRCIDTANLDELKRITHPEVTTCFVGGSYRIELGNQASAHDEATLSTLAEGLLDGIEAFFASGKPATPAAPGQAAQP